MEIFPQDSKLGMYELSYSRNYWNLYTYPFTVESRVEDILYIGMLVAQFYPSRKFDIEQPIDSRLASDVGILLIFGEVFL